MTEFLPTITSPSDWPDNWKDLQTIDSLLRCSICGEFFKDTTFIPSCSHNYCSLCIRRYLNVNSKCPTCEDSVQDSHLQNNRIIDEIVKSFVKIRKDLLQAVEKGHSYNHYKSHNTKKSTELPKSVEKKDEKKSGFLSSKGKSPRRPAKSSQKRHRKHSSMSDMSSSSNELSQPIEPKKLKRSSVGDSDEISIIEDPALLGHSVKEEKTKSKEEDLVDCPVCGQRMPQTKVNFHLDACLTSKERQDNQESTSSQLPDQQEKKTHVGANLFIPQVEKRKPLNKLVYTLLSNTELKRKMKEHGLSIKGERQTLVQRHKEFTIIYNSECSKPRPKSVAEIVRLVEEGERKKNKPVENRDRLNFDKVQKQEEIDKMKSEYMSENKDEFTRLINEIRSRKNKEAKNTDDESNKPSCSKSGETPSTTRKTFAERLLEPNSDDESSEADFELPVRKLRSTPQRQLRPSTERRITRSSAKRLEEIGEDVWSCDVSGSTVGDDKENASDDPSSTLATLPEPPSPLLLDDDEKDSNSDAESTESESILPPAFGPSKQTQPRTQERRGGGGGSESEEIEF